MTQKERDFYGAYVYNQRTRMEEEIKQLQQNIRWHKEISPIDCLELIIAQTRYEVFCQFVHDFNVITNIEQYNLKVNFQKRR